MGVHMVGWEDFLKVNGWRSSYGSVDRFLSHYKRKVRSEKTRENACLTLKGLCEFAGMGPEELVALGAGEVSSLVQKFIDSLADRGYSIRYVNVSLAYLKTFFNINGFKGAKALDVERHHQPSRYRKRSEWIPTSEEIYKMAYASGSTRNRALILSAYSSGLRNSTLRALLYGDIREELENGLDVIRVPVYPEMKNVDSGACKGNISYYSFLSQEAVAAIREYITERTREFGGIEDDEPLFASDSRNLAPEDRRRTPIMKKSFSAVVKRAAKNAGIQRWRDVYPHCLRKAFESALRNGGLDIKDQEFLMGHILPGSQDAYYDKTKIEELRRKYARVVFFPHKAFSSEEVRKRQLLDTARLLGFGDDRLKRLEEVLARTKSVDEAITQFCKLGDR
ncbi:MAG: tyrosine-type recombinase/integrase, partial [Candidatus Bathyarchaeia archaeon]